MPGKAENRVSLIGKARRRVLGLSPTEASFDKRGFLTGEAQARQRLEQIGITFLSGYHAALEESGFNSLTHRLAKVDAELRGFAFEGAAMGLALLDCPTPESLVREQNRRRRERERSLSLSRPDAGRHLLSVSCRDDLQCEFVLNAAAPQFVSGSCII